MMASAQIYGSTDDGYILGYHATTYATARLTATSVQAEATDLRAGQTKYEGAFYVFRSLLKFNTSVIRGEITGATLTMTPTNLSLVAAHFDIGVHRCSWSGALGDDMETIYDAALASASDTIWANTADLSLDTPKAVAVATDYINQAGNTTYALLSQEDVSASEPTGFEYVKIASQEHATEGYRPLLTITYTPTDTGNSRPGADRPSNGRPSLARPNAAFSGLRGWHHGTSEHILTRAA